MNGYARVTGFAPEMPDWATGFWQCKLRYESQDEVLEVARRYKAEGIPIDAIVIDFFHWTEQGNWEFDPEYWPDPKAMCEDLKAMGIEPVVSVWPTIKSRQPQLGNDERRQYACSNRERTVWDIRFSWSADLC